MAQPVPLLAERESTYDSSGYRDSKIIVTAEVERPEKYENETSNDPMIHYYSYRVTIGQSERSRLKEVLYKYSKNFCFGNHGGHGEKEGIVEDTETLHHYHCIIVGIDKNGVNKFRQAMQKEFGGKGNAFHAGKFMDNTVYKGIQYIKHEPDVEWTFRGGHWPNTIDLSPDWEEREVKKQKVEKPKLSYPILTFQNVLKQAWLHRQEHQLKTNDLGQVLEHMSKNTNWQPDIRVMRTGLDVMHFKLFEYKCKGKQGPSPDWWTPKIEARF